MPSAAPSGAVVVCSGRNIPRDIPHRNADNVLGVTSQEVAINISEYFSAERFPLTTQAGLSAEHQLMLDAVRYGLALEMSPADMDPGQLAVWAELVEKQPHMQTISAEVGRQALAAG
jgi:hypothetical protein